MVSDTPCNALVNDGRHVCRFRKGHPGDHHAHANASSIFRPAAAPSSAPALGEREELANRLEAELTDKHMRDYAGAYTMYPVTLVKQAAAALRAAASSCPAGPTPELVDGYDARFWRDSYRMLTAALDASLADCIHEDDVAEEAIYVEAIEEAGRRLAASPPAPTAEDGESRADDVGYQQLRDFIQVHASTDRRATVLEWLDALKSARTAAVGAATQPGGPTGVTPRRPSK